MSIKLKGLYVWGRYFCDFGPGFCSLYVMTNQALCKGIWWMPWH